MRSHTKKTLAEWYHLKARPNGWNLTVELEASKNTNIKLQEVMDIMMTEQRVEQTEKVEHMWRLPHAIKQMLSEPPKTHPFWVAGHRLVRPNVRSLEPLTETDGHDTMLDHVGDDRGNKAIGSRYCCTRSIVVTIHTAFGAVLVLVSTGGQTVAKASGKNKTVYLWPAWTGFFTDVER